MYLGSVVPPSESRSLEDYVIKQVISTDIYPV